MSLILEPLKKDSRGNPKYTTARYQPLGQEKLRLIQVMQDFQTTDQNMNKGYEEFGINPANKTDSARFLSLIQYQNQMQLRFNNNIPAVTNDPEQLKWRANTIRPITRNKVISIVAHITASIIYPNIIAQNDRSEEDKGVSLVMRDIAEWVGDQMDYDDLFLKAVTDMCVNPAIVLHQDYAKVSRMVKEVQGQGKWEWKEIVDEVFSGFMGSIIPNDELYISNVYEPNIQKQDFLVKVKNLTFRAAEAKYKHMPNWKYIKPGLRTFFDNNNEVFYEEYDELLEERLVQEAIYYNRSLDLEIPIINGVLMDTDTERPLQRKDKKYPFAKAYYEMFNTRFYYGMPLVGKLKPDQDVIDTLYNMIIDGTFLELFPPMAVYGAEDVDSSVYVPGTTTSFKSLPDQVKLEQIGTGRNLSAGMAVLQKVEASAGESSQDPLQAGQQMGGDKTKYEVVRLEQNAKTVLGLTGKMIAGLVEDFGELLIGSIVQFLPIAEIGEMTGDDVKLKFPSLFIPEREIDGKIKNRQVEFLKDFPETPEDQRAMEFDLLSQEEFDVQTGEDNGKSIAKINPSLFRRMKYLVKVEPDFMDKATKFFKKLQIYDRAVQNPLANQEAVFRDFLLNAYVPGEEDKYIKSEKQQSEIMDEVEKRAGVPTEEQKVPAEVTQEQI